MQGAIEMDDTGFDLSTNTLYGVSVGPEGTTHNVIIYVPDGYQWSPSPPNHIFNQIYQFWFLPLHQDARSEYTSTGPDS
jgi:hypothetical protein